MKSDEVSYLVALSLLPGLGEMRLKSLLMTFGSAKGVCSAPMSKLRRLGALGEDTLSHLKEPALLKTGADAAASLRKLEASVVTVNDDAYPSNLRPLDEAPPLLYVMGELKERDSHAVAIVGSRRATAYGRAAAERLAYELAGRGVTVVSGFANGIDTAAHKGALRGGGRTVAVLGCGLDVNYPASNSRLRERIIASGALVTEFPLGTRPLPGNFPKRNRIVSGLSLGIVVVEAAPKSGTFSTVKWAAEQGREVFAVPGDINRRTSEGTNRLIADGAKLTTCADDILEEIGIAAKRSLPPAAVALTEAEKKAVNLLEYGPIHIDEIARNSKMNMNEALALLLELELKGIVRQAPGKIFSLERGIG